MNLFTPVILAFIIFCFNARILDGCNVIIHRVLLYIESILFIVLSAYLAVLAFLPKKVVLYQNMINIKRYNIPSAAITRGFTDDIPYSAIISCKLYNGSHYSKFMEYSICFYNRNSVVKIVCDNNKEYYIPVKNTDDFIDEVNERVQKTKFFRILNIDSLLKDKNGKTISYYDLKVRWKSSDKIDSVYYTDDEGNDIDIINY